MIQVALKGLLGRKLRAFLTAAAIVLGVAMISGTYVLTDTIKAAFNTVFTEVYQNTDAVISGKSAIGTGNGNNGANQILPSFPQSLLARVRQLPGVAEAEGGVDDQTRLVGRDGKVIASGGPGLAFSVNPAGNQRFNPLDAHERPLAERARRDGDRQGRRRTRSTTAVGDTIGVVARGPVKTFRIVGLVKFGDVDSLGGASIAIFDLPTAQRLFDKVGKLDSIGVGVEAGRLADGARPGDPAHPAADRAGPHRPGAGEAGVEGHERLPQHPPGLPARVRRRRAVRRRLRDREHAVDHDRAADARAGDVADARRDQAAGALVGDARGVRDRRARLGERALPRGRPRARA